MCQAQPVFPFWLSLNLLSLITAALRDGLSGDIDEGGAEHVDEQCGESNRVRQYLRTQIK